MMFFLFSFFLLSPLLLFKMISRRRLLRKGKAAAAAATLQSSSSSSSSSSGGTRRINIVRDFRRQKLRFSPKFRAARFFAARRSSSFGEVKRQRLTGGQSTLAAKANYKLLLLVQHILLNLRINKKSKNSNKININHHYYLLAAFLTGL